ncbi:MAG: flagellar basal body P-ring formation chaperone FlgA [Brevirhabdus sp.]
MGVRLALVCLAAFANYSLANAATDITELVAERAATEYNAALPPEGWFDVRLADGKSGQGEYIREFWLDPKSGKFIANVVTEMGDVRRVWGAAILTVSIPVPIRRLEPGDIVSGADLQSLEMPWARLSSFAATQMEDLVGMQVRRALVPGRAVARKSVMPPSVVSRGQKVMIELSQGSLRLSVMGRALSDAYLGQEIRVVNLSSNKTIVAVAIADGRVEVRQ